MEVEDGVEELLEGSRREEWRRGSAQLRCALRTGEEGERGGKIGLGNRNGNDGVKRWRDRRHGDTWRRRPCTPSPWQNRGGTVTVSNVFELLLIVQIMKFHIGTRI